MFDAAQRLLARIDIVDIISRFIPVNKKGNNYVALCPFHDDTNPSLSISPDKQIFKCFVCGKGGNAINFVSEFEKISYFEAARRIADMVNFSDPAFEKEKYVSPQDVKNEPLYKALNDLTTYYEFCLLTKEGEEAVKYLENRKINQDMRKKYRIGLSSISGNETITYLLNKGHSIKTIKDIGILGGSLDKPFDVNQGRIMFPIHDQEGRVVGFSGRIYKKGEKTAKYMNSPETPVFHKTSILYNYHRIKSIARNTGYVYVLEGFMDVFALNEVGIESVVALMGTALTKDHINLLRMLNAEVRLCLDGDEAGQSATLAMTKVLDKANLTYTIVDNKDDMRDPDDILKAEGKEGLLRFLNNLVDKSTFTLNYYLKHNPLSNLKERKDFVNSLLPTIANLKSALDIDDYLNKLVKITNFGRSTLEAEVAAYKNRLERDQKYERAIKVDDRLLRKREISKLQLAEQTILYQMIHFPEAVKFYNTNVKTFINEFYQYIAQYLTIVKKDDDEHVYANIYNYLNSSLLEDERKKYYQDEVMYLEENDKTKTFNQNKLNDALRAINEEKESYKAKIIEEEVLSQTSDPIEKAILAEHLRKQRKERLNKKGKDPKGGSN
ncbi:MAG TPA: DNA primase [Bacilli bacterium]|jgi:DNA primase|nr:DNA primase [Bacilli bacterium]